MKSKGRTSPDGKTKPRRLHRDTRPSRSILYLGKNHRQTQPATAEKLGRLEFLDAFFLLDDFVEGKDFFRFHGFLYVSFERKYNRDASYRCVCDFSSRQQVPFRILYLKHPVQQ